MGEQCNVGDLTFSSFCCSLQPEVTDVTSRARGGREETLQKTIFTSKSFLHKQTLVEYKFTLVLFDFTEVTLKGGARVTNLRGRCLFFSNLILYRGGKPRQIYLPSGLSKVCC